MESSGALEALRCESRSETLRLIIVHVASASVTRPARSGPGIMPVGHLAYSLARAPLNSGPRQHSSPMPPHWKLWLSVVRAVFYCDLSWPCFSLTRSCKLRLPSLSTVSLAAHWHHDQPRWWIEGQPVCCLPVNTWCWTWNLDSINARGSPTVTVTKIRAVLDSSQDAKLEWWCYGVMSACWQSLDDNCWRWYSLASLRVYGSRLRVTHWHQPNKSRQLERFSTNERNIFSLHAGEFQEWCRPMEFP